MKIIRKIKIHVNKVFVCFSLFSILVNTLAPFAAMIPSNAYAEDIGAPVEEIVVENKEEIASEEEIDTGESVLPASEPDITPLLDSATEPENSEIIISSTEPRDDLTITTTTNPEDTAVPDTSSLVIPVSSEPSAITDVNLPPSEILTETAFKEEHVRETPDFSREMKKQKKMYVEGEVVVKFNKHMIDLKSDVESEELQSFKENYSLEEKGKVKDLNIQLFESKIKTEEQIRRLESDPNVEYVQPNYIYEPFSIDTNDPYKGLLWGLDNTGQEVNGIIGTFDADIDAPEAWELNEGSADVIVAIVDTGVAYNHPDLSENMWDGSACLNENGAYLGRCEHGYDFEDGDRQPLPTSNSHGTHIAGTIGAVKNNGVGIIGVAPSTKMMAIKTNLTTFQNVQSINFAKYNNARIINASWGGPVYDQALKDAIESFDGVFVAASGNGGEDGVGDDNDTVPLYPSSFDSSNIISVAATDQNDELAGFSNYGEYSVDVGAPGVNIYSTIADSYIFDQDFNSLSVPNIPSGWVKEGVGNNWGTYDYEGDIGKVLYGDLSYPYANNSNTTVATPSYDLSTAQGANLSFLTVCDTYYSPSWTDYMALEFSSDGGTNYEELLRWDEYYLDYISGEEYDSTDSSYFYFEDFNVPNQYLTDSFKIRLRWVTDGSLNNFDGCWIDDINLVKFTDGYDNKYDYYDGTSMATPHVAGAAALIMANNPSLTVDQIIDIFEVYREYNVYLKDKVAYDGGVNISTLMYNSRPLPNPTIHPASPIQFGPVYVTMDADVLNPSIKYTIDGSDPDCSYGGNDLPYDHPLLVSPPITIKAITCHPIYSSDISSVAYTLNAAESTWYLAEGSTGGFSSYILVQNPSSSAANITATFMISGGENISKSYTVPAESRYTIIAANEIGTGKAFSTKVESDQDIIVERAMYWDAGGVHWAGGHNTMGFSIVSED